jgi:hypothetical protein
MSKVKFRFASSSERNCEAANGVKFVEIHFSFIDTVDKDRWRVARTVGGWNLLNINYHPARASFTGRQARPLLRHPRVAENSPSGRFG